MARQLPQRPNTDQITDSDGILKEEWAKGFDDAFLYLKELQEADLGDGEEPITLEQIQGMIDTSVTTALESVPVVRTYVEYVASAVKSNTITHNLNDPNPQVTFDLDLNPSWLAWVRPVDENSIIIEFQSGPATDMTVVVWSIVPETSS